MPRHRWDYAMICGIKDHGFNNDMCGIKWISIEGGF